MKRRISAGFAVGMAGLLMLSACASGPIYRPRGPDGAVGYSDEHIAGNRYRISFSGNYSTKREEVDDFMLRRAAEVTLQAGFTHFDFDDRNTEASTYYRMDADP